MGHMPLEGKKTLKKLHYPKNGWTELGTQDMLNTVVRLLRYALPLGKVSFNRPGFWQDISRSVWPVLQVF